MPHNLHGALAAYTEHEHDRALPPGNTHCRTCTTPTACDQAVRCPAHPDQTDDTTLVRVMGSVER